MKQLRGNKDNSAKNKLMKLLGACLYHFPPSAAFENYLESFLIGEMEATGIGIIAAQAAAYRGAIAKQCVRFMHESILQYGYDLPIHSDWNSSLRLLRLWLIDSPSSCLPSYPILPPLPKLPDFLQQASSSSLSTANHDNQSAVGLHDYLLNDLAFQQDSPGAVKPANEVSTQQQQQISLMILRGTRDDWNRRFTYLTATNNSSLSRRSKPPATLTMDEFAASFADNKTPIEDLDRNLLLYLIFGYDEVRPIESSLSACYERDVIRCSGSQGQVLEPDRSRVDGR
jgi:hypothetical protein